MAVGSRESALAAAAPAAGDRPPARRRLPAPVDVDCHQLVRRPSDHAGVAAHGRDPPARQPDADGLAHGDGDRAVRALLAAGGCLARPRPKASRLRHRRVHDRRRRGERARGVVDGLAVAAVAVRLRLRHRHRLHHGRQCRADRADPGRLARPAGRGTRQECARQLRRGSRRAGRRRRAHQGGRRTARVAGRCGDGDRVGGDPARHRHPRGALAGQRTGAAQRRSSGAT